MAIAKDQSLWIKLNGILLNLNIYEQIHAVGEVEILCYKYYGSYTLQFSASKERDKRLAQIEDLLGITDGS